MKQRHPELLGLRGDVTLCRAAELAHRDTLGFWKAPILHASAFDAFGTGWIQAASEACQAKRRRPSHVFVDASKHPAGPSLPSDSLFVNVDASAVIRAGPVPPNALVAPPERDARFWGMTFPLLSDLTGRQPEAYGLHNDRPVAFLPLPGDRHLVVAAQGPT